jgi:hypothetical protein
VIISGAGDGKDAGLWFDKLTMNEKQVHQECGINPYRLS